MFRRTLGLCVLFVGTLSAADRLTLTGNVTDVAGKPLDRATVMVFKGGVKQGYSTYCPTCYADCGKRALTTADGNFTIASLSPGLFFDLLVVREGYSPEFVKKVDPARNRPTALLRARPTVTDLRRIVRGLVVDSHGDPVRDAVVQPQGILAEIPGRGKGSMYGPIDGLEPVAVTNEKGEFYLTHAQPFEAIVLDVEARGMAPKIATGLASGAERHRIVVTDGAVIRGRLVQGGKPVANAEVGLMARQHGWGANLKLVGYPIPEIRVGTNEDGTFAITNVPPSVEWYVYGKMESLAKRGGAPIRECATTKDGEELDIGDLVLTPTLRFRGRVVLSDGNAIRPGMRITVSSEKAFDSQTAILASDGSFEFGGLARGSYTLFASVRGYRSASGGPTVMTLDGDMTDYVLRLDPQ
jgi:hypothetical protein